MWLTFFFDRVRKQTKNPDDLLQALLQGFDSDSQAFINELRKQEKSIDRFKTEIFADPHAQQYALSQLLAVIKPFKDAKTIEIFRRSSPLAKIIAVQILAKAVSLYDKSVKTLKTSFQYSLENKTLLFKEMLEGYLSLLDVIALELVGEGKFPRQGLVTKSYLDEMHEILKKPLDRTSLEALAAALAPSTEFNVQAAMFGSGALFYRHLPSTLEDIFTLTHQNLIACVNFLLAENIHLEDITPPALFHETLEQIRGFRQTQLIGIEQDLDQLVLRYNAPLRNHSSTFQLTFREGIVFLTVQLLGEARSRWSYANQFLQMLDALAIQPLYKKPYQYGAVLNFLWRLENQEQVAQALTVLNVIYNFSLDQDTSLLSQDLMTRVSKHFPTEAQQNEAYKKIISAGELWIQDPALNDLSLWSGLLQKFIEEGRVTERIIRVAADLAVSDSVSVKRTSVELLINLISKGCAYPESSCLVDPFFKDKRWEVRRMAAELIHSLVNKLESMEQAALIAKEYIDDEDDFVFASLVDLWEKMRMTTDVDRDHRDLTLKKKLEVIIDHILRNEIDVEQAHATIARFADDADALIKKRILQLLIRMKSAQSENHIFAVVENYIKDPDPAIRICTLELWIQLVAEKTDDALNKILSIGMAIAKESHPEVKKYFINLLSRLINKNQISEELFEFYKILSANPSPDEIGYFLHLLLQFVKADFKCNHIVGLLEQLIIVSHHPASYDNFMFFEIFTMLVVKGHGLQEAFLFAQKIIESREPLFKVTAFQMLEKLIDRQYDFLKIAIFAERFINDPELSWHVGSVFQKIAEKDLPENEVLNAINFYTRLWISYADNINVTSPATTLFSSLIEKNRAPEAIAAAAEQLTNLSDLFAIMEGVQFLENLVKKGFAREKAAAVVERFSKCNDPDKQWIVQILAGALSEKSEGA
jgi:hypothetical protein